jgi:hypothetical protein
VAGDNNPSTYSRSSLGPRKVCVIFACTVCGLVACA